MTAIMVLLVLALFFPAVAADAQLTPVECPLPPYQLPLQAPERTVIDEAGQLYVDGAETPLDLDGLTATEILWSNDGEILLIQANSPDFESHVFAYRNGELTGALGGETLSGMRTEDFRDAVKIFNPVFVPGTHIVLFNTELLTDAEGIYVEIPQDLWSLDLDSGELTEILPYGEAGEIHVAPDGSTVVLLGYDFIRQMDIDGGNPRTLFEGTVAMGLGHGVNYPDMVWDKDAEVPTFRVLLFPAYDPNSGGLDVPFEVREFVLGEDVESHTILEGPAIFFPTARLSPDGYRVAHWWWTDENSTEAFDVTIYQPDAEPLVVDSFQIANQGGSAFIRWDDETHLTYGYIDQESMVTARRADLCGEITELEPYKASMAEVLDR